MTSYVSYRRLVDNSQSGMLAAIEIYNKPRIEYREEIFVQLLVNSWELLLKAILSKSRISIFYPKKRNEPQRTLNLESTLKKIRVLNLWPSGLDPTPVELNLGYLKNFRDQTVHFYGGHQMAGVVSALAVSSIVNYQRVLVDVFGRSLHQSITWELMPLSFRAPSDVINVLRSADKIQQPSVREFVSSFAGQIARMQHEGRDSGLFAMHVNVTLESKKKIIKSDLAMAISVGGKDDIQLPLVRRLDPNSSHPLRQRDAIERIGAKRGKFNSFDFQAIAWKFKLHDSEIFCWTDRINGTSKWSHEVVSCMLAVSTDELGGIRRQYSASKRRKSARKSR